MCQSPDWALVALFICELEEPACPYYISCLQQLVNLAAIELFVLFLCNLIGDLFISQNTLLWPKQSDTLRSADRSVQSPTHESNGGLSWNSEFKKGPILNQWIHSIIGFILVLCWTGQTVEDRRRSSSVGEDAKTLCDSKPYYVCLDDSSLCRNQYSLTGSRGTGPSPGSGYLQTIHYGWGEGCGEKYREELEG